MAHQEFMIEDAQGNRTPVTSNADGSFSVSLAPGKYRMLCGSGHEVIVVAEQTVTLDCDFQMV